MGVGIKCSTDKQSGLFLFFFSSQIKLKRLPYLEKKTNNNYDKPAWQLQDYSGRYRMVIFHNPLLAVVV